jgi:hypothetical protein
MLGWSARLGIACVAALVLGPSPAETKSCPRLCKDEVAGCKTAQDALIASSCAGLRRAAKRACKRPLAAAKRRCRRMVIRACQADSDPTDCTPGARRLPPVGENVAGTWSFDGTLTEVEGCTRPSQNLLLDVTIQHSGTSLTGRAGSVVYPAGQVTADGFFLDEPPSANTIDGIRCTSGSHIAATGHGDVVSCMVTIDTRCDDGRVCRGVYTGDLARDDS